MIQLNPMLPLWHVGKAQPFDAFLVLDYSQEHDLMLAGILRDGEIWVCRTSELRGQENVTLGRPKAPMPCRAPFVDQPWPAEAAAQGYVPKPCDA